MNNNELNTQEIKATSIWLENMLETIRLNSIAPNSNHPSLDDLQKDPEWIRLFNDGYYFVTNISIETYNFLIWKESDSWSQKREEIFTYRNCWYFKSWAVTKITNAYVFWNPSNSRLKESDGIVALFTKKSIKPITDTVEGIKKSVFSIHNKGKEINLKVDENWFVNFWDVSREILNKQAQYGVRYLFGIEIDNSYPFLWDGLRIIWNVWNYYNVKIYSDDIEEFVKRYQDYINNISTY